MTVHTMRQVTALQRANARWRLTHADGPTNAAQPCNVIPFVRPHEPTLIDRINNAVARAEESRITWTLRGIAALVGYIIVCAQAFTRATGVTP